MKDGSYWAEKLRKKQINFQELLEIFEANARVQNPKVNAFVTVMHQEALDHYQQTANVFERPFAGLPIPLKMLGQEKENWLSTSGSKLLKEHRASHTSNFTNKLIENGLIPFAQTNTPEFGFKNVTDAKIYGPARNPWNLAHYSGGSSGGAASAVAAGMVPIAAASNGGGSIRIPASFCGLIGLKPTRGAMPVGPNSWRGWQGAAIDFALTVSMRDTEKLFYGMRGTDTSAPYQTPQSEWTHHTAAGKKKLKIALIVDSPVHSPVSPDTIREVEKAADFLLSQGHTIERLPYPVDGQKLIQSYYLMNGVETAAMFDGLQQQLKRSLTKSDMEIMTWGIYQYGKKIPASHYSRSLNHWDQAAFTMENLLAEYDLLLTPTTATTAPKVAREELPTEVLSGLALAACLSEEELADLINRMFWESLQQTPFTQLANLTGQPAISLPTGVCQGLPLGIQFMAARGREDLLFQVGRLFEQACGFQLPEYYR